MITPDGLGFDTLSLHAGQQPDAEFGAHAQPIYMTTSYLLGSVDEAASLFNLETAGHVYSRISNPTVAAFEERVAALEGGVGAVATSSGQAALFLSIATLMGQGGHIVASGSIYGGSRNMFNLTLPRFGITTTFVNPRNTEEFAAAITEDTRLVYGETLGNPGLEIIDMQAVADIAHGHDIPLMIDNTFASPYLCRPIEWGADIVMNSATKWIGGHGVAIGGVIVDGGVFDWEASGKFPTLTEPYEGYHGINFSEEYGTAAFISRARAEGLRDFGSSMSPQNAFYLMLGLETLSVRMDRHVANATAVAELLDRADEVAWVSYPTLESHPDHERSKTMLPKGPGAIFSFGIKGGREAGRKFIEAVTVFSHLANVGDAKSLVIHPGSTTHQQMSTKDLEAAGISEDLIRLSIGMESIDDLLGDLKQALRASQK
jgi:O-acetylhomoserine (thiol)-lyase